MESSELTVTDLQDEITSTNIIEEYRDENISSFITHELLQGIYTFKDLSEVLLRKLQLELDGVDNAIDFEFDDISMKNKLVL